MHEQDALAWFGVLERHSAREARLLVHDVAPRTCAREGVVIETEQGCERFGGEPGDAEGD
jgi:hypothetical protein